MKAKPLFPAVAAAAAVLLVLGPALLAGLPQPMCVYYGQARDGYGLPYMTNADVILLHGTTEVARQSIRGSLTPGVNFALYVHLDDGQSSTPYSSRAVRSGDVVSIIVREGAQDRTIMESRTVPRVGKPGELVLVDATASDDADGDGLPDTWEQELIAWSDGALSWLSDVRPEDDFDGDGMTNLQEYRAGTFAFLSNDYLAIEQYERTSNERLRLTFLSVRGKVYSVACISNISSGKWQPSPMAAGDTAPFQETPVEGTGDWLSLYVPVGGPAWFFRLEAK
jgi:hypothetical protein